MDITSLVLGLICGGAGAAALLLYRGRDAAARLAALDATLTAERAAHEVQLATLTAVEGKMASQLKQLSQEALTASNQQFLQLAETKLKESQAKGQTDLTALLTPLKAHLDQLAQHNQSMEQHRAGAYEGLTQQILSLREETGRLSRALRAPQTRGRWGEVQLQRLIELAGLQPYADYSLQTSFNTTDDGHREGRLRPDCIISLPGGKQVVIDVKTPLEAYMDAEAATDEQTQREAMTRFARHVRTHVQQLSSKEYHKQLERAPDYVILFLPGEHFMSAALRENQNIFEEALERNVILASTATLMILLKAYAHSWQQEAMVENAQKVSQLGRQLFERLSKMGEHFTAVGTHIARTMKAYNETVGTFESRVLVSARRFNELSVTTDQMPELTKIDEVMPRQLAAPEEAENTGGAEILQLKTGD